MMKRLLAIAALACAFGISSAQAEPVDVATTKCADLAKLPKDEAALILTYLSGYYSDDGDDPTVDAAAIQQLRADIEKKCTDHPDFGLRMAIKLALG